MIRYLLSGDWLLDIFDHLGGLIIGGLILFVVGGIGMIIYSEVQRSNSPTMTLYKSEWECTGTRQVATTIYIQVGKVMVPQTTYHDECVEYKKR